MHLTTMADTDAQRQEVLDLFLHTFSDIAPNAVPMTDMDSMYAPLVAQYSDSDSGALLGAALTCRAQLPVGSMTLPPDAMPPGMNYAPVLDKHSELDLMAVVPTARGRGIGTMLLSYLEHQLNAHGVRVWFGNATTDLDTARLRRFYCRRGFTVLDDGQPLPRLLGRQWHPPGAHPEVAFYFYKQLTNTN